MYDKHEEHSQQQYVQHEVQLSGPFAQPNKKPQMSLLAVARQILKCETNTNNGREPSKL